MAVALGEGFRDDNVHDGVQGWQPLVAAVCQDSASNRLTVGKTLPRSPCVFMQ